MVLIFTIGLMSVTNELQMPCPNCQGPITYPPAMAGQLGCCPHCMTDIQLAGSSSNSTATTPGQNSAAQSKQASPRQIPLVKIGLLLVGVLLIVVAGLLIRSEPNEKANALFVEATKAKLAGDSATSFDQATRSYVHAAENVQRILDDYPNTEIAVQLVQGKCAIGGNLFIFDKFMQRRIGKHILADLLNAPATVDGVITNRENKVTCMANLRAIDDAVCAWADANKKDYRTTAYSLTDANVLKFFENGRLPQCPSGGTYSGGHSISLVAPSCSLSHLGHTL